MKLHCVSQDGTEREVPLATLDLTQTLKFNQEGNVSLSLHCKNIAEQSISLEATQHNRNSSFLLRKTKKEPFLSLWLGCWFRGGLPKHVAMSGPAGATVSSNGAESIAIT